MRIAVVGGGLTGLTLAHRLASDQHEVTCFEPGERPGGWLRTERRGGFLCESGPQSLLDGVPETTALVAELGLSDQVVRSHPRARRRQIYVNGRLRDLPRHPLGLIFSDLLSVKGKWDLFHEPFVPRGDGATDESVLAFGQRRLGPQAAARLVAPATIGIFAGDAGRLSLASAFPRLAAMEKQHGSLFQGLRAARRAQTGPGGSFSFRDGLETLPRALVARLGNRLRRAEVTHIQRHDQKWTVTTASGPALPPFEQLVLASTLSTTANLLRPLAPQAAQEIDGVPRASVAVVCLGFASSDIGMDLTSYGFLVARGETPTLLGCQYESSTFPGRAPAGSTLLRVMLGGVFEPQVVERDDLQLQEHAVQQLQLAAGLRATPGFSAVFRAPRSIPQYEIGHAARVARVDEDLARLPGLHVLGWTLRGIAMNDCIRNAAAWARRVGPSS